MVTPLEAVNTSLDEYRTYNQQAVKQVSQGVRLKINLLISQRNELAMIMHQIQCIYDEVVVALEIERRNQEILNLPINFEVTQQDFN